MYDTFCHVSFHILCQIVLFPEFPLKFQENKKWGNAALVRIVSILFVMFSFIYFQTDLLLHT